MSIDASWTAAQVHGHARAASFRTLTLLSPPFPRLIPASLAWLLAALSSPQLRPGVALGCAKVGRLPSPRPLTCRRRKDHVGAELWELRENGRLPRACPRAMVCWDWPRSPTGRSAPLCSERGKRTLTQRPGPRLVPQDKQPLSAPGTRQSERDRPESCERGLGACRCVARRRVGPPETGSGIRRCWHPSLAHPGKPCRPPVPPPLPVMAEAEERGSCYRPAKGSNCSTQEAGGEDRASCREPG